MPHLNWPDWLNSNTILVADGGLATTLYDRGFYINRSFEELSVVERAAVADVTCDFAQAGARLLSTNTFNATRPKLTHYGLQNELTRILTSALEITKEVADRFDALVSGVIGPSGLVLEPLGPTSRAELFDVFCEVLTVFASHQVDVVNLCGFHDLSELEVAIQAHRECSTLPLMLNIAIQEDQRTSFGHTLAEFVEVAHRYGADAMGCAGDVGPSGMLTACEQLRRLTEKPLSFSPNAGLPRFVNDQYIYLANPDYVGKYAKRLMQAGARIIGGHCGFGPPHIQAIDNAVRMQRHLEMTGGSQPAAGVSVEVKSPPEARRHNELLTPLNPSWSRLARALVQKTQIFTVEIVPPKGVNFEKFAEHCRALEAGGVEFVNIPDGARAVARTSSLHLANWIQAHTELEPIPHVTTRDRNLIGLQADLLGMHVGGVRNVLVVTGDPPKLGNCPGATAVYDVDAIGLTHIVQRLNRGLDLGGSPFGESAQFVQGVAVNPTARNQDLELKRFGYKSEAGAHYAITQPIYSWDAFHQFFANYQGPHIPVIVGIWPLVSLRNAEFLKNEVPGVEVPDWVIERMQEVEGNSEASLRVGKEIAIDTIRSAPDWIAGFQISAPFNRVDVALDVIQSVKMGTSR